jgi:hypothetical protein
MRAPSPTPFRRLDPDMELRQLEQRLNDGYELIEQRRSAGLDVSKLEDFWIDLLHEYEERCDNHPLAA